MKYPSRQKQIEAEVLPHNIGSYIERENIVLYTPATVLPNGKVYRLVKGNLISEHDFLKLHPPVNLCRAIFNKGLTIGHGKINN